MIHLQFENVPFTRDNPNVPSDLEQMPHLLNFIENNGPLLANEHSPLIAHTANDLITGLTGVYPDQHGPPMNNSFEYDNNSSLGAYNTSAFTYWTDTIATDPANPARVLPAARRSTRAATASVRKLEGALSKVRSPNPYTGKTETCFIRLHGNVAPDINNTWAALVGPGVVHKGVDSATFVDHADLRSTMMTLLCLQDAYVQERRRSESPDR